MLSCFRTYFILLALPRNAQAIAVTLYLEIKKKNGTKCRRVFQIFSKFKITLFLRIFRQMHFRWKQVCTYSVNNWITSNENNGSKAFVPLIAPYGFLMTLKSILHDTQELRFQLIKISTVFFHIRQWAKNFMGRNASKSSK